MTIYNSEWAMPNHNTYDIKPINEFINRYIKEGDIVIDPFARNSTKGTITNDLNPDTSAMYHEKADVFLQMMNDKEVRADVVLYDPPYSPRQITECYSAAGIKATQQDTQSSFYTKFKNLIPPLVKEGGLVLSFGWNSSCMGKKFGEYEEILLVGHGGAHNDTICVAQRKFYEQ